MILELNVKDVIKKVKLKFSMKKIVEMTKKNKGVAFKDLFFSKMNTIDFEFLANLILAFYDKEESDYDFNGDINKVYGFIENYVESKENYDYQSLYVELSEAINDKSFFGKMMSETELKAEVNNPLAGFDINQIVNETAQSIMKETVAEEFRGYRG